MKMRRLRAPLSSLRSLLSLGIVRRLSAQSTSICVSRDHPAIQYSTRPTQRRDRHAQRASRERRAVSSPSTRRRAATSQSVLKALDIPPSSQTLVFSENSLQREHISKATPRAVYFNDTVAVGWAKGADSMEVTALDPAQGVQFYSIAQKPQPKPQFVRRTPTVSSAI